jgi:hypothetical protein
VPGRPYQSERLRTEDGEFDVNQYFRGIGILK